MNEQNCQLSGHSEMNSKKHSEYDARAASVRAHIEKKLEEIEAKMTEKRQQISELESPDEEESDFLSIIQNLQTMDVKRSRSCSLAEMKETAISRLKAELDNAQMELKLKDEEVAKLSKIRDEVGSEIEDLTASLFEEANNMVNEANVKRSIAEKSAKEANMKLNVLLEEVAALKTLIQTYMPIIQHTQPMCEPSKKSSTPTKPSSCTCSQNKDKDAIVAPPAKEPYEPDPVLHQEFVSWRQNPIFDKNHPFLKRIYWEDIDKCMSFENKELADEVLLAIEERRIIIENISGKVPPPKLCALLQTPRFCHYRMNLGGSEDYFICNLSRNRIAAICDLFCYLRYIENGLVTQSVHDTYLEILKKRKAVFLARLGLCEFSLE